MAASGHFPVNLPYRRLRAYLDAQDKLGEDTHIGNLTIRLILFKFKLIAYFFFYLYQHHAHLSRVEVKLSKSFV